MVISMRCFSVAFSPAFSLFVVPSLYAPCSPLSAVPAACSAGVSFVFLRPLSALRFVRLGLFSGGHGFRDPHGAIAGPKGSRFRPSSRGGVCVAAAAAHVGRTVPFTFVCNAAAFIMSIIVNIPRHAPQSAAFRSDRTVSARDVLVLRRILLLCSCCVLIFILVAFGSCPVCSSWTPLLRSRWTGWLGLGLVGSAALLRMRMTPWLPPGRPTYVSCLACLP